MRTSCLLVLLLMSTSIALSQSSLPLDTLRARYENDLIHFMRGYPAKGYNGGRISYGDLRYEYSMSPEGLAEYNKFRPNQTVTTVLLWGSLAAFAGSIIAINNHNDDLAAGLIIGGSVQLLAAIPFGISANKHLQRSVWLRNRDLLLRTR
jgi:hypothetical protein